MNPQIIETAWAEVPGSRRLSEPAQVFQRSPDDVGRGFLYGVL